MAGVAIKYALWSATLRDFFAVRKKENETTKCTFAYLTLSIVLISFNASLNYHFFFVCFWQKLHFFYSTSLYTPFFFFFFFLIL